jgi:hypothetical protein
MCLSHKNYGIKESFPDDLSPPTPKANPEPSRRSRFCSRIEDLWQRQDAAQVRRGVVTLCCVRAFSQEAPKKTYSDYKDDGRAAFALPDAWKMSAWRGPFHKCKTNNITLVGSGRQKDIGKKGTVLQVLQVRDWQYQPRGVRTPGGRWQEIDRFTSARLTQSRVWQRVLAV